MQNLEHRRDDRNTRTRTPSQPLVIAAGVLAGGALMLGLTGNQPKDPSSGSRRGIDANVVGVAANNEMLFRVWSDGSVDYLKVSAEMCRRYHNGVPDWALFTIDHTQTHDRQGNPQPKLKTP